VKGLFTRRTQLLVNLFDTKFDREWLQKIILTRKTTQKERGRKREHVNKSVTLKSSREQENQIVLNHFFSFPYVQYSFQHCQTLLRSVELKIGRIRLNQLVLA